MLSRGVDAALAVTRFFAAGAVLFALLVPGQSGPAPASTPASSPEPAAVEVTAPTCAKSHWPGDFNGDGFPDAVIADPGATVNGHRGAGIVQVRYGTAKGLGPQSFTYHQGQPGVGGTAGTGFAFGSSLAVGYVNGDSCADLVVGAPGVGAGTSRYVGSAYVIYGSTAGLGRSRYGLELNVGNEVISGSPGPGDRFGAAVAVSNVDPLNAYSKDETAVVAVGAPGRDVGPARDAGAVFQVSFNDKGTPTSSRTISQSSPGVPGASAAGDGFGSSLDVGYVDGPCTKTNHCLDLVVGAPGKNSAAGAVTVVQDVAAGSPYTGSRTFTESTPGVPGAAQPGDRFGASMDYQTDGITGVGLLAVGLPGKDIGSAKNAGVVVLFELDAGFDDITARLVRQGGGGVLGKAETGDGFGTSLLLTQYQSDFSMESLVVGAPGEDIGRRADAGAVQTFDLRQSTPATRQKVLSRATTGVPGVPRAHDRFGQVLGEAGYYVLLVGVPGADESPGGGVLALPWAVVDKLSTGGASWLRRAGSSDYGSVIAHN